MFRNHRLYSKLTVHRVLAVCGTLCLVQTARTADVALHNPQQSVVVHDGDGSYEIVDETSHLTVIHARVGANLNHHWVTSSDYPQHRTQQSAFEDALGKGHQVTVQCTGTASQPDLVYVVRLYDTVVAGDIEVEVRNRTAQTATVTSIRPVEAIGARPIHTGPSEDSDRILSDSFSEDWPPLKIYDLAQAPKGMLRAVGSQLIYNRATSESLFFGALRSDRFLTIIHWKVNPNTSHPDDPSSYTIDSTGTTEIQASDPESGLRNGPAKNLIELSLPLPPGAAIHSERLMFAVGSNYYSILEQYGAAVHTLHHSRPDSGPMLGWWSWTAFYSGITQGNVSTNAQWLAQHLEHSGFDYFHLDLGYSYARGEYATPNAAQFPDGMLPLARQVSGLGLRLGLWTAPFEVSDRAWVYEHHKDWLVHNADGEPIQIGVGREAGREVLFVLDTTHPEAQEYLRNTYLTLTREWGARYIKLDFMDNTAIEGYYHRPHTTALEAQRIGLEIIRQAVGEHVLLDKDGSPMLNPVGLVDEGRLSQDTGHRFLRSQQAAPGIAARYYMNHNFFLSDPDAFTVSSQMIEERRMQAPLTLDEAQASIALAAVSGGMFEIGDDLPTLGSDPARVALVTNPDVLQMVKLGQAARPLDLMTYAGEDQGPSVFLLQEDRRQAMLAVFNWTETSRSHTFQLADLSLPTDHTYHLVDIFHPEKAIILHSGEIRVEAQAPHSVRLIKMIDDSIPAQAPSIAVTAPARGAVGAPLHFSASPREKGGVPPLSYHWEFGDGVVADGANATHTYTRAGSYQVGLTVDGVDGVPYRNTSSVVVNGTQTLPPPQRYAPERH